MKTYLARELTAALAHFDGTPPDFSPEFEKPKNPEHGDLATNAAMQLARHLRRAPRLIAEELAEALRARPLDPARIASVEAAGSGFVNFRFATEYLTKGVQDLLAAGDAFGRSETGRGKQALVEYVSANPTGPLTVGHGRNAVLGDAVANLLAWNGYDVTREYYFNDGGRQMRVLGESVRARYQAIADPDAPRKKIKAGDAWIEAPESFPEDGYFGAYVADIAERLHARTETPLDFSGDPAPFQEAAQEAIFADIRSTLNRIGVRMDTYFNERTLYENDAVWRALQQLRDAGHCYDRDGAVWFRTTAFGKEQDTVLVKSSGEPTYRLPDIAYHADKCDRGFDRIVNIFGADHIATYPDVLHGLRALGHDADRVEVIVHQFVTLVRGGAPVKMSTRRATYVTLDELMDEVGEDVARFFFLMRSPNAHLEFDLDLAKEANEKNPVFYLQYAHARICSILRKAAETGFRGEGGDVSLLEHPAEIALMKAMLRFPEALEQAADAREPHQVAAYLREVAAAFTQFYGHCRIIGEENDLAAARMRLARAARIVLSNGLQVLGVSRPERM